MRRRAFIEWTSSSALVAVAAKLSACASATDSGNSDDSGSSETSGNSDDPESSENSGSPEEEITSGSETSDHESSSEDTGSSLCEPTEDNIEGPFYREGIPERNKLDLYDEEARSIELSGIVRDQDCNPIPNAIVEIWHANTAGEYDIESEERRYYGWTRTNNEGRYSFSTLEPGRYLNGAEYRPAHIHLKVWTANDNDPKQDELRLTTQVYFAGDPYNDKDAFIKDSLIVNFDESGKGSFDISV